MSFGQRLKNRLHSLQEEITAGVKNLSVPSSSSVSSGLATLATGSSAAAQSSLSLSPQYRPRKINFTAGCKILEHYGDQWEAIHVANEANAKIAAKSDTLVQGMRARLEKQWNDVLTLQMLVSQVPTINKQIQGIMQTLGNLESSFNDVEIALLALEDTIDARELQERQLEERFQVAMFQEQRQAEYDVISGSLRADYERKKQEAERSAMMAQKNRHFVFKKKFEEDMTRYTTEGQLRVPTRIDTDASLETVDLNEEDSSVLENFLEDVSPLPVDDVPVIRQGEVEAEGDLLESSGKSQPNPEDDNGSFFFTPDSTDEKLKQDGVS